MTHEPALVAVDEPEGRGDVVSALWWSVASVVWTVVSSGLAIFLGVRNSVAVLVAFGAIGLVDGVGSVALVHHFRHGRRHDELSDDLEKRAHTIVLVGLLSVGCAALIGGLVRLRGSAGGDAPGPAVVLSAVSCLGLVVLSVRKQRLGRALSSNALISDGHLSAIGAIQAAVTLIGTGTTRWLKWHWADPVATAWIGCAAIALSLWTFRTERSRRSVS
jgi:divalent metal cation (Fe/Co/Zn/Cd) transporter